jgi:hypothetical protein
MARNNRQTPAQSSHWVEGWLWVSIAVALVGGYSVLFLGAPLLPTLDADGQISYLARWQALLIRLTYPDGILPSWTAGGQMALAMADRLALLVGVGSWIAAGWWIGRAVAGWACGSEDRRWWTGMHRMERLGLESLLGLAMISHGVLALGVLGWIGTRWPLVCGLALALLAAWRFGHRRPMERDVANELQVNRSSAWERRWVQLGWMVIAFLSALVLWGSLMPPIEFDVRAYHLQAPKEFFQQGAIGWVDHNVYANMPLGAEMHALAWMVLWGGEEGWYWGALIGKGVIAAHAVLAALLLAGHLTRLAGRLSGMGAAMLWLGTPGIAEVSRLGLIEAVLAAYLAACWVVVHRLMTMRVEQLGGWFLLGLFAGAAAACKYTALPFVVAPMALLAIGWNGRLGERWWNPTGESVRQRARGWFPRVVWILVAGMFLGGGGWYLKNAVLGGNPVFPLAGGWLGGGDWSVDQHQQWHRAHEVPRRKDLPAVADFTATTMIEGVRTVFYRSAYLGWMLVPMALAGLAVRSARWAMFWWLLGIATWWLASHRLERFWLPLVPLLVVAAGWGIGRWRETFHGWPVALALGLHGLYGVLMESDWPYVDNRIGVALQDLRADLWVSQSVVPGGDQREAMLERVPAHQRWINSNLRDGRLKEGERVLMVGDARVFDLRVPIASSSCFDRSLLEELAQLPAAKERAEFLRRRRIGYLAVDWGEIERYRSPGNYGFSQLIDRRLMDQLVEQGVLERIDWPLESDRADLYRVLEGG